MEEALILVLKLELYFGGRYMYPSRLDYYKYIVTARKYFISYFLVTVVFNSSNSSGVHCDMILCQMSPSSFL